MDLRKYLLSFLLAIALLAPKTAAARAAAPLLTCRLEPALVSVGAPTVLWIEIQDVQELFAYQLELLVPQNMVTWMDADPQRAGVNFELGGFLKPDFIALNDTAPGKASLALTQVAPSVAASGSGVIARIELVGAAPGTVHFVFNNTILVNPLAEPMGIDLRGCSLEIIPTGEPTKAATVPSQPTLPPPSTEIPGPLPTDPQEPQDTVPPGLPATALPTATASPMPARPTSASVTAEPTSSLDSWATLAADVDPSSAGGAAATPAQPAASPQSAGDRAPVSVLAAPPVEEAAGGKLPWLLLGGVGIVACGCIVLAIKKTTQKGGK
jgi:hypothetical protein